MNLTSYFEKAITLNEYFEIHAEQAKNKQTSGPEQSENLIRYTKINNSRSRRSLKTIELEQIPEAVINKCKDLKFLIISETWCGDSAQVLPVLSKISDQLNIESKVVWRDENLELMDAYLTNGGRSIPKLIVLTSDGKEAFTWGPRPAEAQELVMAYKNKPEPKESYDEFSITLQNWYNDNAGKAIVKEISELIKNT